MSNLLSYSEAISEAFNRKWVIGTCSQGEDCWCRIIKTDPPINFLDGDSVEEYHVVGMGSLDKNLVDHIIELHNKSLGG